MTVPPPLVAAAAVTASCRAAKVLTVAEESLAAGWSAPVVATIALAIGAFAATAS